MLVMKSGKLHQTDGIELSNKKIKTLGEKETYKFLGILAADSIRQVKMKEKLRKNISRELKSYARQNYEVET